MTGEFREIAGLTHIPMRIACSWVEKTVTTEPPRYIPHKEYSLCFGIACDEEILLTFLLLDAGKEQFGKSWRSAAHQEWKPRLSFFPMDWSGCDAVQVNFEGLCTIVDQTSMKHDPRSLTATLPDGEHKFTSGSSFTVARINAGRLIECRIFAVAKVDTEGKRGRWALKSHLAAGLPNGMQFLSTGKTAGTF